MNLLFVGSFDPVTYGHLDLIHRAAKLADILYVGVGINNVKKPMFTAEERIAMLEDAVRQIKNVKVIRIDGLTADAADILGATLVRGLRNINDFVAEQQIDQINKEIHWGNDTIYLMSGDLPCISSSAVKALLDTDATEEQLQVFCPLNVVKKLLEKRRGRIRQSVYMNLEPGTGHPHDEVEAYISELEQEQEDRRKAYQGYLWKLAAEQQSPETAQKGQDNS